MNHLKCLIIDDEPLALDLVENFLTRLDIRNVTRCENGIAAFQRLLEEPFDLLILDIEMPLLGGIDLLKSLPHRPSVIITTAYRDYAVEGFELEVLDYLVKPFSFPRFMQAIQKVSQSSTVPSPTEEEFLFLKAGREWIKIGIRDIRYIESRRDYILVNTTKGEWLCHQTLTDITARLPAQNFFRPHRSYTVALDKIDLFRYDHVRINEKSIPVSRENRQELRRLLSSSR